MIASCLNYKNKIINVIKLFTSSKTISETVQWAHMVFTCLQCAFECTLTDINIIHFIFTTCVFLFRPQGRKEARFQCLWGPVCCAVFGGPPVSRPWRCGWCSAPGVAFHPTRTESDRPGEAGHSLGRWGRETLWREKRRTRTLISVFCTFLSSSSPY